MAIDYSALALPKPTPRVVTRKAKQKDQARKWRRVAQKVDERDEVDGDPVCFITGKRLQIANPLDEWTFRDRAHLRPRSVAKVRRYRSSNVLSVSRAVHKLLEGNALFIFNKRGQEARSVASIDHVAWNRRIVAKRDEPCRIRKGLAVREMTA